MKPILAGLTLIATLALPSWARSQIQYELTIKGMVCAFCAQGIEKRLSKLPSVESVKVSLKTGKVAVALKADTPAAEQVSETTLRTEIQDAGYSVSTVERREQR